MGSANAYSIRMEERGGYVFARVETKAEPVQGKEPGYLERIADHCSRCRCSAILVEKHTPEPFQVWDAFTMAPKLSRIGHQQIRMALVEKGADLPAQKKLSVCFGEHVGLAVRVFKDIGVAERWLLTDDTAGLELNGTVRRPII